MPAVAKFLVLLASESALLTRLLGLCSPPPPPWVLGAFLVVRLAPARLSSARPVAACGLADGGPGVVLFRLRRLSFFFVPYPGCASLPSPLSVPHCSYSPCFATP